MICEFLYKDYLAALVAGDRARCLEMLKCLVDSDAPLRFIYVDFLQRALYDVGVMWEQGKASVATEHMATLITETLMSLCLPKFMTSERKERLAVVACPGGERHHLGAKMVASFLEILGWDVCVLGADTPTDSLLAMIDAKKPRLLCLSISLRSSIPILLDVIGKVRERHPALRIIVGGQGVGGPDGAEAVDGLPNVTLVGSIEEMENIVA